MTRPIHYLGHVLKRLALPALLGLALFPPGPTRPVARADEQPAAPAGPIQIVLPLIMGGAAPDLTFEPAELELTPGTETTTVVRVHPAADLRAASFDLPGVQDGVTSSFAAAADGQSGILTLAASTATQAGERALIVRGTNGDGTSGWVGRLKVKTKPPAGGKTLFVDPAKGKDSNAGTQDKPFKTLAKALSKAKKGDIVKLGPGVYSQDTNGERYTSLSQVLVPSGVTIEGAPGTGDESSILEGTGVEIALNFAGDATVTNLVMEHFNVGIVANQGKLSLRNLFLQLNNLALSLNGSTQATLANSLIGLSKVGTGVSLRDHAQFLLDGAAIVGGSITCELSTGISAVNTSRVTLKNGAHLLNIAGNALFLNSTTELTMIDSTIDRELPSNCASAPSISLFNGAMVVNLQNSRIINSGGTQPIGISLNTLAKPSSLTLSGTTVSGFKGSSGGAGIKLINASELIVRGNSRILGNNIGIDARANPAGNILIIGSELSGNNIGITSPRLKLRNSTVKDNGTGILITDINGLALADLGVAGDIGGNTLKGNTLSGLTFAANVTQGGALARGNTWNLSTQGASADGRYPDGFTVRGRDPLARGDNFDLPNPNLSIEF
jgi:hypothetical protein